MSKSKKEVLALIKLQIPLGGAKPVPPIGPALGQRGLNIMEFCKQFNAIKIDGLNPGDKVPVVITAYKDKSFTFVTKMPTVPDMIKKAINLNKGSSTTGKEIIGKISVKQITEIAQKKMVDMNTSKLESAIAMVRGSAVSMGLEVVD